MYGCGRTLIKQKGEQNRGEMHYAVRASSVLQPVKHLEKYFYQEQVWARAGIAGYFQHHVHCHPVLLLFFILCLRSWALRGASVFPGSFQRAPSPCVAWCRVPSPHVCLCMWALMLPGGIWAAPQSREQEQSLKEAPPWASWDWWQCLSMACY